MKKLDFRVMHDTKKCESCGKSLKKRLVLQKPTLSVCYKCWLKVMF